MEQSLVVCPCRYAQDDPIRNEHAHISTDANKVVFKRQTNWERYYLEHASQRGCIIFWLGCEDKNNPRTDGGPYGRDTYGEQGAWRVHLKYNPSLRVVIGAEPEFSGLSVIKCNLDEELGYDFPIYSSMEETVKAAVRKSYE